MGGLDRRYLASVSFQAPMSDVQRAVIADVVAAIAPDDFDGVRERLITPKKGLWLPAPLLTVAAALIDVVVAARADPGPWMVEESVWDDYLPERRPRGRSEWRNANYALHAAGCLAAGVWLDVGRQESFWNLPLWPFALDVVELLTNLVLAPPAHHTRQQIQDQLLERLQVQIPASPVSAPDNQQDP